MIRLALCPGRSKPHSDYFNIESLHLPEGLGPLSLVHRLGYYLVGIMI